MGQIRCIHQPFQHFVGRGERGVENWVNLNRQVDLINLLPLAFDKSLISFKCWYKYFMDTFLLIYLSRILFIFQSKFFHISNIFLQSFASKPRVFVSVKYTRSTKPNDAMYLWLENVNSGGFEVNYSIDEKKPNKQTWLCHTSAARKPNYPERFWRN